MAVQSKSLAGKLRQELDWRLSRLTSALEGRSLTSEFEGAGRKKHWTRPENMRMIDSTDIQMAVDDFKTILSQIRKL